MWLHLFSHHDPVGWLWSLGIFIAHLLVAAGFAVAWRLTRGQGPLERVVGLSAKGTRRLVLGRTTGTPPRR